MTHKDVLDNFFVEVKIQLNKNPKNLARPATLEFPQLQIGIQYGKSDLAETMMLMVC